MYATTVGLVLAGFRSLDEREDRYKEQGKWWKWMWKTTHQNRFIKNFFNDIPHQKTKVCWSMILDGKNEY